MPTPIDRYLAALPAPQRRALQALRRTIRTVAPGAEERVSYGIAAFRLGRMLVGIGATSKHCALYLMSARTLREYRSLVAGLDASGGTIRFMPAKPLPQALVRRLVRARIAENAELPPAKARSLRANAATFFADPAAFRSWLGRHHATATAVLVGLRRVASDRSALTWADAVDQALCFGWIDGVRRRLDADRYTVRFTPRQPGSTWSARNITRLQRLAAAGEVMPAGHAAFAARTAAKSRTYSYERTQPAALAPALQRQLVAEPALARFHDAQAPSYRRKVVHWIMAAKADGTRRARLQRLLAAYRQGRRL
ncbi:MAG: DUF1801 domain-containing protein [Planctomycetota bacterium]